MAQYRSCQHPETGFLERPSLLRFGREVYDRVDLGIESLQEVTCQRQSGDRRGKQRGMLAAHHRQYSM
jgi:hypothetical protein